jgi:hypothetical protein
MPGNYWANESRRGPPGPSDQSPARSLCRREVITERLVTTPPSAADRDRRPAKLRSLGRSSIGPPRSAVGPFVNGSRCSTRVPVSHSRRRAAPNSETPPGRNLISALARSSPRGVSAQAASPEFVVRRTSHRFPPPAIRHHRPAAADRPSPANDPHQRHELRAADRSCWVQAELAQSVGRGVPAAALALELAADVIVAAARRRRQIRREPGRRAPRNLVSRLHTTNVETPPSGTCSHAWCLRGAQSPSVVGPHPCAA